MPLPELKIPETLGACADLLHDLQEKRYKLQRQAADYEEQESQLREHIIRNLPASEGGAMGKRYKVTRETGTKPVVKDWPALWKYVFKNKATEMLQRRLAEGAVQERWEAGKKVPGVETFTYVKLSLTKVR